MKLDHQPIAKEEFKKILSEGEVITESLFDIRHSSVPIVNSFELTDEKPIYNSGRRLAPKQNQIIREGLDKMLEARVIRPALSAWSFSVINFTKKDGKP